MKAVFVTTFPNDVSNVIAAWDCWNDIKATRIIFDYEQPFEGQDIIPQVADAKPDVIFYIGGCGGSIHQPAIETLRALREIAPSINLCFDGGDKPWHVLLDEYRLNECFDLQVTIDGCLDCPVDLVTTAPVDTSFYTGEGVRDIFCGISGNLSRGDVRSTIVTPLVETGLVEMRLRDQVGDGYPEHVVYMHRCQMIINTSYTGSGLSHHVKQRVFETGFAGAALLEDEAAPTAHWIPSEMFFTYKTTSVPGLAFAHAADVIRGLESSEVAEKAVMLKEHVRAHYTPQQDYGGMLDRL